jgi:hypothetical protein
MHVQVMTADTQPVSGIITATNVQLSIARTDFSENAIADLDGLVTKLRSGSGSILSFDLEGKEVRGRLHGLFRRRQRISNPT